jgi:hypothetical protein
MPRQRERPAKRSSDFRDYEVQHAAWISTYEARWRTYSRLRNCEATCYYAAVLPMYAVVALAIWCETKRSFGPLLACWPYIVFPGAVLPTAAWLFGRRGKRYACPAPPERPSGYPPVVGPFGAFINRVAHVFRTARNSVWCRVRKRVRDQDSELATWQVFAVAPFVVILLILCGPWVDPAKGFCLLLILAGLFLVFGEYTGACFCAAWALLVLVDSMIIIGIVWNTPRRRSP